MRRLITRSSPVLNAGRLPVADSGKSGQGMVQSAAKRPLSLVALFFYAFLDELRRATWAATQSTPWSERSERLTCNTDTYQPTYMFKGSKRF